MRRWCVLMRRRRVCLNEIKPGTFLFRNDTIFCFFIVSATAILTILCPRSKSNRLAGFLTARQLPYRGTTKFVVSGFTVPRHIAVEVKQKGRTDRSSVRHHTLWHVRPSSHGHISTISPLQLSITDVFQAVTKPTHRNLLKGNKCAFCLQAVELDNTLMAKFVSFKFILVPLQGDMKDDGIFNTL